MISSISNISSTMSMTSSKAMQRQQPPPEQDVFKVADSDSNGLVSSTELETLVDGIKEITGNSIDIDEALSSYDADQDGSFNGEELQGLMASQGFAPPEMSNDGSGDSSIRMPPPPKPEQAVSAYAQNTGEDTISQLIEILQGESDSAEEYSPIEITA